MSTNAPAPEEVYQELAALRRRVAELEEQLAASAARSIAQLHDQPVASQPSQYMLQLIIDSLPGAIFWKNYDLVYQGCNRLFAQVAGMGEPQHIVGKTDYELAWKREEAEFFRTVDRRVMESSTAEYHIIEPQQQADGKQAWLDTNKIPLYDEADNVVGILGTFEDITERKQMEEALRASEDRFRTLVETIAVAAWIHQNGRFCYVNPATEQLLGYSEDELFGMEIWQIIHPDFCDIVEQRAAARQRGEDILSRYEIQVVTKNGETRWVDLHASRIEFDGQLSILVTFLDITERKQMEETLRASEERFRTLIDTISVAVVIHHKGHFRYVNVAAEEVIGYRREQLNTMTLADIIHPDFVEMVGQRGMARLQGQEVIARYEIQILTGSGEARWIDVNNSRIEFNGELCILVSGLDITERKQMEEERAQLQETIIRSQEASLRELSTPMFPISRDTVVMPLIGRIDTHRAQQVMEGLLEGIARQSARTVILDITGVPVVDTQVALGLVQAAQAVRLLGARVILTGVRPDVAQSLVGLDVDLSDMVTLSSLQAGVAYATRQQAG